MVGKALFGQAQGAVAHGQPSRCESRAPLRGIWTYVEIRVGRQTPAPKPDELLTVRLLSATPNGRKPGQCRLGPIRPPTCPDATGIVGTGKIDSFHPSYRCGGYRVGLKAISLMKWKIMCAPTQSCVTPAASECSNHGNRPSESAPPGYQGSAPPAAGSAARAPCSRR
jgi:hypothetical protein